MKRRDFIVVLLVAQAAPPILYLHHLITSTLYANYDVEGNIIDIDVPEDFPIRALRKSVLAPPRIKEKKKSSKKSSMKSEKKSKKKKSENESVNANGKSAKAKSAKAKSSKAESSVAESQPVQELANAGEKSSDKKGTFLKEEKNEKKSDKSKSAKAKNQPVEELAVTANVKAVKKKNDASPCAGYSGVLQITGGDAKAGAGTAFFL
jgi:hypothetical protein